MTLRLPPAHTLALALVGITILGTVWTPHDPAALSIADRLQPPSLDHLLGTDHFGRDILSMVMAGANTTLSVAGLAVLIGMLFGVPLGLAASARKGRWTDGAILRFNDLVFAFPALLTAVLITARFGPGAAGAMLAIGIFNIPVFARISRAAAMPLWQQDFILAASLAGKGRARMAAEHILPNILPLLMVQAAIQFSIAILAEAGLAYLGLGAQPPEPSWGRMLADGQTMVGLAPHVVYVPGLCILLSVMALNAMAEELKRRLGLQPRGSW